jgi:hypothetical protein
MQHVPADAGRWLLAAADDAFASARVAERCQASLAADAFATGTEPNSCCRGWRRLCMLSGLAGAHVR